MLPSRFSFGKRLGDYNLDRVNSRHPGIFDDLSKARISAVVSYTRHWRDEYGDDSIIMAILQNPNASKLNRCRLKP
jgi:hypothetical protein